MDETSQVAVTLNEAIGAGPAWLRGWVGLLIASHVGALAFVVWRDDQGFHFRAECVAIFASFIAAAVFMGWLHDNHGYVRLLGLAHLVFWTPVYLWMLSKRSDIGTASWYGRYVHAYLAIAGLSLVIDLIDVIRYALGDTGVV